MILTTKIKIKLILSLWVGFTQIYNPLPLFAKDINSQPTVEYIRNPTKEKIYIIGPGDQLRIEINEYTPLLNSIVSVDGEGFIDLKRLKSIFILPHTVSSCFVRYVIIRIESPICWSTWIVRIWIF